MFYWDMDGVLAVYDYDMYTATNPAWDEVGSHCFLNVQRDNFVYDVIKKLTPILGDEMGTLTRVSDKSRAITNEQIFDKMTWLSQNYSMLNLCNFMCCVTSKNDTISKIKGMRLSRADILVDDWNKNLFAWQNAGGTAVKWLNGLNSVGIWPGYYIDGSKPAYNADDINTAVKGLLRIWIDSTGRG